MDNRQFQVQSVRRESHEGTATFFWWRKFPNPQGQHEETESSPKGSVLFGGGNRDCCSGLLKCMWQSIRKDGVAEKEPQKSYSLLQVLDQISHYECMDWDSARPSAEQPMGSWKLNSNFSGHRVLETHLNSGSARVSTLGISGLDEYPRYSQEGLEGHALGLRKIHQE